MLASDLIKGSLRLIGAIATGETPSASELADGLVSLNDLLDSWSTNGLLIYQNKRESFPLIPGKQAYTIGLTGDLNTDRPVRIKKAFTDQNGLEIEMEILETIEEWAELKIKSFTSSLATKLYVEPGSPFSTINLWPIPNIANNLVLYSEKPLTSFATSSTDVPLPSGYARALRYNLALELAPEFGREPSALVVQAAMDSKADIQRINTDPVYMSSDETGAGSSANRFDYRTGQ